MVVGDGAASVAAWARPRRSQAIRKGVEDAKKLSRFPPADTTIPEMTAFRKGPGALMPRRTALSRRPVRAVIEAAVLGHSHQFIGTNNPINVVRATIKGLERIAHLERLRAFGQDRGRAGLRMTCNMKLKITQTKSTIACLKKQIATIRRWVSERSAKPSFMGQPRLSVLIFGSGTWSRSRPGLRVR